MFNPLKKSPASPAPKLREFEQGECGAYMIEALEARGVPHRYLGAEEITRPRFRCQSIIRFEMGRDVYYFDDRNRLSVADPAGKLVPGPIIDGPAAYQVTEKGLASAVLRQHGLRVPISTTLPSRAAYKAAYYFSALSPKAPLGLCVKPTSGHSGRMVRVGITRLDIFQMAFKEVGKYHNHVMIEETVPGAVYRILCVAGRAIAVSLGTPANVRGDGRHSISELIDLKNASRKKHPIRINRDAQRLLEQAGYGPETVPPCGVVVSLGDKSNFSRGADVEDATDDVHPSYLALAEKAVSAFPGLVLCGVDLAIEDATAPARANYHVLELNSCPSLALHYLTVRADGRPVAEAVVDFLSDKENAKQFIKTLSPSNKPDET